MPNSIPGPADIIRHVLPNGIVLLVRENPDVQSVILNGAFAGGAAFETDPAKFGVAAITADAMMRGTTSRDFLTLHETLESAGMSLDFSGGRYLTSFDGKALGEDLPLMLELLGDILKNPSFPEEHVELIKGELITGLRYNQQDTRYMANKTFQELIYPKNHIYHRGSSGEIETVANITADDLRLFHQQQYGPGEMILVIVGAIKAQEAIAQVEQILGDWTNPRQRVGWDQPEVQNPKKVISKMVALPGKSQSDIVLGIAGPARNDPDFQAANLGNNVLGVFGMMGRLGKSVREEQGLAYYSYSGVEGGMGPGAWRVSAGVNPANVKKAVASIRSEVERMVNEPISEADIADNKANLITRLPLRLETNEGVAANLMAMERYGLGLDYLHRYPAEIEAITIPQIQAAMQKYWQPDGFALAVAGPKLEDDIL